ncbi:MAG: DUF1810 domain-containing protein [Acidobacteriaceae bacterium]
MELDDPYNLRRFVEAQDAVYPQVCAELRGGRKTSHWIWFIFPQIRGLGASETAQYYAISSREEAKAYLEHPVLGSRLRECTALVGGIEGKSIEQIFGHPDNLKFRSSMTLFAYATEENQIFLAALKKYFGGEFDPQTLTRL